MSIVESLNLSPIRVRRRRNQEEEESIEHELKKYFIPAYEPKDNLRREQNILLKMKENERLYDEAYENFRKRKETNPNFGYTKHRNKLSKRKKQKSLRCHCLVYLFKKQEKENQITLFFYII